MHLENLYDSAKRFGESLCLWHTRFKGCKAVVARMSWIYGPFLADPPETLVTEFIRQAVCKRAIELESPESVRTFCSVLDAVQGILRTLARGQPGRAYNVASHEHLSVKALAEQIARELPFPVELRSPVESQGSIQRISVERARQELGFDPRYTFGQFAPLVVTQTARALTGKQYQE